MFVLERWLLAEPSKLTGVENRASCPVTWQPLWSRRYLHYSAHVLGSTTYTDSRSARSQTCLRSAQAVSRSVYIAHARDSRALLLTSTHDPGVYSHQGPGNSAGSSSRTTMPSNNPPLILGRTNWRDRQCLFGMRQKDRLQHLYIIGQTGTGKTTLLQNLIWQDLKCVRALAFIDPHGDAIQELMRHFPENRQSDLLQLDLTDRESRLGFNPLAKVPVEQRALAASGIVEAFRNIWQGVAWGARLEHILRNALLTLLDQPSATLADLPSLFTSKSYREKAIVHLTHPATEQFWQEFAKYPPRYRSEAIAPVQNKLGAFLSQAPLYRVLARSEDDLELRKLLDEGKVLLVNLAKGVIGADGASLLGSLLVSSIALAGLSRADTPESLRSPFYLYLDEFQSFSTRAFADMLSELRKYGIGLVLAHQYVAQLDPEVRSAVLGNVGSMVAFRIGPEDARTLARQFGPEFDALDLVRLPNHDCYLRLLVKGQSTLPFSATTLPQLWNT